MGNYRYRDLDEDEVISTAGKALARSSSGAVSVSPVETISDIQRRNLVIRAVAAYSDGSKQPIIVKATRSAAYDPKAKDSLHTSGLFREWAATALLKPWADNGMLVSQFLAGDSELGLIVTHDLGSELPSLVEPLLGDKPSHAEKAILEYAAALGNLHAKTVGCNEAYNQIAQAAFPHEITKEDNLPILTKSMGVIQGALGGRSDKDEIAVIAESLDRPGQWQALVHGDLCPDNVLFKGDRACFIDFEAARPGHALLDTSYLWMGFPSCWCAGRLPEALSRQAEQAYLRALSTTCRTSFEEASYRLELAHICAAQMLRRIAGVLEEALVSNWEWGIAAVRSRILWGVRSACNVMSQAQTLPVLNVLAERWAEDLEDRWEQSEVLSYYPAFENVDTAGL
ncbi:MAG: phosphotransferase [Geminicoccaceae bacterium]